MADKSWKAVERWMCALLGGTRDWEHGPECKDTGMFAAEVKYRKKIPNWLEEMVVQAERLANDNQLPFVALFEHHRPRMDALVIIRLQDFYDWYVSEEDAPAGADYDDQIPDQEE
jgi:hypothetical protein